jgi:hypothetical protein
MSLPTGKCNDIWSQGTILFVALKFGKMDPWSVPAASLTHESEYAETHVVFGSKDYSQFQSLTGIFPALIHTNRVSVGWPP